MTISPKPGGERRRRRYPEDIKQRLLDAARMVVGDDGYSSSSIARITSTAGVAHGTFYNYFASQQEMFDELLPHFGRQLLKDITEAIGSERDFWRREEIGFRTFFRFVQTYPQFYRILNEAETFATKGYREHIANMVAGYIRAVRRGAAEGALRQLEEKEIEVVVLILLAARNYLCMQYALTGPLPDFVTDTYMGLVRSGLSAEVVSTGKKRADVQRAPVPKSEVYPEAIWNLTHVRTKEQKGLTKGALATGFTHGDIARASAIFSNFAQKAVATFAALPEERLQLVNLTITLGTGASKPFSPIQGTVLPVGENIWSIQIGVDAGDQGSGTYGTCIVGLKASPADKP